jgi:hypothetical protein
MKVPLAINSASHSKNLARSIAAANSVLKPSPAIAAKAATTNPVLPAVLGVAATAGIPGYGDIFKMVSTANGTDLVCELPYSPKVYAATADIAMAIAEVPGTALSLPVIKPIATPVAMAAPKSLESYIYSEFVAAGGSVSLGYNAMDKRSFVLCKLSTTDDIATLLADGGGAVTVG